MLKRVWKKDKLANSTHFSNSIHIYEQCVRVRVARARAGDGRMRERWQCRSFIDVLFAAFSSLKRALVRSQSWITCKWLF